MARRSCHLCSPQPGREKRPQRSSELAPQCYGGPSSRIRKSIDSALVSAASIDRAPLPAQYHVQLIGGQVLVSERAIRLGAEEASPTASSMGMAENTHPRRIHAPDHREAVSGAERLPPRRQAGGAGFRARQPVREMPGEGGAGPPRNGERNPAGCGEGGGEPHGAGVGPRPCRCGRALARPGAEARDARTVAGLPQIGLLVAAVPALTG